MVLREPNDPLNQSRGIMGPLENATGVQNNRGRLRQRFDLIRKLGQGTYGKVQLGIDKETGQEVAIKTIKKSKIETEADLIRIRREIQIMSSVRHPNIIHIYEVFENREKMVLVMEYAAGGELYDYLNERKILQDDEARRIFRQIASAVYYCHKHKICHRDLKLENILLDEKFNAKIADFGLSNVFDEVNLLKTFCGSPLYASPEIVRGTPYKGPEVDCWSLGVLLYTLVYGAMPFDGSNFKRLVKQISHGDYFEPKKPAEASPLIRIMLTVDPKKRADIKKVCSHPWVNDGFDTECLSIADELATQTPVRLDLLLALANCSAINHSQVVIEQQPPPIPPPPGLEKVEGAPPLPPPPVENHVDTKEQPTVKKPKRTTKLQSKSKSSPMLELIKDDVEEELELAGKERDEEDACDTLSEISEIQTIAEDLDAIGGVSKTSTGSDAAVKGKQMRKVERVKSAKPTVPPQPPQQTTPVEPSSPVTPTPTPIPKKTEVEAEPKVVKKVAAEAAAAPPSPAPAAVVPAEEKAPVKKKIPVKPKPAEEPKPVEKPKEVPAPAPSATAAAPPEKTVKEAVPSSRETTPAPKEKSASPGDNASESGEEGKSKRLKDRADSVSPTRIERRNSKVISQKTAELIQNLETKVSPSGTQPNMEPPPKPPGIKKIVIPSFKVSDAKSKFEAKPPRPLTTSVSRSKAAFEAKLQSQSSVEEKTPPVKSAQASKGESPPTDTSKPKTSAAEPAAAQPTPTEKAAALPAKEVPPSKAEEVVPPKPEPPVKAPEEKKQEVQPKAEPAPLPKQTPAPRGPGKIQIPSALSAEKAQTGNEVKPVLLDSGKGAPRAAVMVVKGKAGPLPDKSVPQAEPPPTQTSAPALPEPASASNPPACTESISVAPPESDTEGETGKSSATAPPLGPAAAAKQKLLSKLPPAAAAAAVAPAQNGNASTAATTAPAAPGANKEQAAKKISSVITKIVSSGSVDKNLNLEDGGKKVATPPRAKPEGEKIVKTEVVFPVSAAQVPATTPKPAPLSKQQPSQERIIPIQLVDEVITTPPGTPATPTNAPSASPSTVSVTSKSTVTPAASRSERLNSLGSLYSRQNSSETESCSVATAPPKLEPIRKCPREFLIPIKLEGSGQTVTPREELTSGGSTADASQIGEDDFRIDSRLRSGRFARPKRYSSLLSDSSFEEDPNPSTGAGGRRASAAATATTTATTPTTATHTRSRSQGDEPVTPGGTFKRYRNRRHATAAPDMPLDRSDSFSSAEEDEEDAFQVLTAESLFSNLLDRVRNLTRRINRDDPLMSPNWSTDPTTFGLWGASPLREFMSSRAPSETRSFASSGPASYRRENSVTMNNSAGGAGGAWRRSLSRDLSGDSDSGHSASINTTNGGQSRSQMSRLSADLYETGSARSLPLSTRRSPSYLSHRSDNDHLINPYGHGPSRSAFSRTLSHTGGDFSGSGVGSGSGSATLPISRTLPLRRSLKTFDRGPQSILPEYDTTPTTSPHGAGSIGVGTRHSLLDSKYESPSSYLTRLRSASRERHLNPDREGSVTRIRSLYSSSGEANGWDGGQDALSSLASSSTSTAYSTQQLGGASPSISTISTGISLDSEDSILSPTSSFSYQSEQSNGGSPSRLLSVQEKMNNYSQYYQSLTQSPFRRLPLASPSQIHSNSNSSSFGVGLSEIRNGSQLPSLSRPTSFHPGPSTAPCSVTLPLKVEAPEMAIPSSTSDDGSATPYVQSPNTMSSVTSPSISPPQIPSPVTVTTTAVTNSKPEISPKSAEEIRAAKPPPASSIPRWPSVSVKQLRPLSISSFPDGPRASSVSRVMSPPPVQDKSGGHSPPQASNGVADSRNEVAASVQKRRDARATSVERITRLLERKSLPREVTAGSSAAATTTAATTSTGSTTEAPKKKVTIVTDDPPLVNGEVPVVNGEAEKSGGILKKPKFLQNLEKKWEKLTHSGSSTNNVPSKVEQEDTASTAKVLDSTLNSCSASPEPHQAGGTSEESSTHDDKINESVLLRRALSPEKKVKAVANRLNSSGGTVGFMLGKFKKLEETPLNSSTSKIPTGRPPLGTVGGNPLTSRLGRRVQLPYTGTNSDSVLTLTQTAKETGRTASGEEEGGLIKSAAAIAQEKRRIQPKIEVKKDVPSTQGPTSVVAPLSPPQIHIDEDHATSRQMNGEEIECLPKVDISSLSPISVSEGDKTESSDDTGNNAAKSDSGSVNGGDDAESVSDRILRKSFYNRFNATGIDRNRRAHSVTPGSSRRIMGAPTTQNNLRVTGTTGAGSGSTRPKSPAVSGGLTVQQSQQVRRSVSPAASTIASLESKESSGSDQSSQNRSPSPYWSGLNKYNPNPLFKELMIGEDFRSNDVGKKTEYSRRITSKLSKLLREIESDLNSCQLTKTGSEVSDDGDSTALLLGVGSTRQLRAATTTPTPTNNIASTTSSAINKLNNE